jgi:hypothetical protein
VHCQWVHRAVTGAFMDPFSDPDLHSLREARLSEFDAGIESILHGELGDEWPLLPDERRNEVLTERQRYWWAVRRFYVSAICSSGHRFDYLGIVFENPDAFEAIGATKTIAAAESLRRLYEQSEQCGTQEESRAFYSTNCFELEQIDETAEDEMEFANLLIKFAEAYPGDFPRATATDPLAKFQKMMEMLQEQAALTIPSVPLSDEATAIIANLRKGTDAEGHTSS